MIHSCNTNKRDCYIVDIVEDTGISTNCSNYNSTEDTVIRCYHIIGHPSVAIGIAGGVLTLIKALTKVHVRFYIWFYREGKTLCGRKVQYWFLKYCHTLGLIIYMQVLITIAVQIALLLFNHQVLKLIAILALVYLCTLFTLIIPWRYFLHDEEPSGSEEEKERREKELESTYNLC